MQHVLVSGGILSLGMVAILIATWLYNPRLLLRTYPDDVKAAVPPKTAEENRQFRYIGLASLVILLGIPLASTLLLKQEQGGLSLWDGFLHAFGVFFTFNLVDLLLVDWLLFCWITPSFVVIPGTEGMRGYKNYAMHATAFLKGTILSAIGAGVIALLAVFS
jgi:hypothetical protein